MARRPRRAFFFDGGDPPRRLASIWFPAIIEVMTITVLLFASYAEALGASSVEVDLPQDATLRDVVDRLRRLPGADRLPPSPLLAVNARYAAGNPALRPGDEVAVIPPVAGG